MATTTTAASTLDQAHKAEIHHLLTAHNIDTTPLHIYLTASGTIVIAYAGDQQHYNDETTQATAATAAITPAIALLTTHGWRIDNLGRLAIITDSPELAAAITDAAEADQERAHAAETAANAALDRAAAVAHVVDLAGSQARAAALLGISQPTVNALLKKLPTGWPPYRSTRALARAYRAHGYDLDHGGYELHRRRPDLQGMYDAWRLLEDEQARAWREEHPQEVFMPLLDPPAGSAEILAEYRRRVDAIADAPTA